MRGSRGSLASALYARGGGFPAGFLGAGPERFFAEAAFMPRLLTYGVPTDRCGLQLRLGVEKGFFCEEGIDLKLRVVFGGPEIAAELAAGRLLVGELGAPPGLAAMPNCTRVQIVSTCVPLSAVL